MLCIRKKKKVVVDRALSPPGQALQKLTKFLDCCSNIKAAESVLTRSFNSEVSWQGHSVVDKCSEAFFVSLVSWSVLSIKGEWWEEKKLLFFHALDTELILEARKVDA